MLDRNKQQKELNCVKSSVQCVEWNLPDIPCLGIKTGDMLDDVTFAIVRKICEKSDEFDLESIDLSELVERFNITEPAERTIRTLLQLCVDNDVRLHKMITNLMDLIPGASEGLNLDLKCFKEYDSYGNQKSYDVRSVLQDLIDEACLIRDQFTDLQQTVNDILGGGGDGIYVEPLVDGSCIGTFQTSKLLKNLASDYCTLKGKIGTVAQLDIAIGKQDISFGEKFITDANFVQNPSTLAESENNQWIILNDFNERLESIEACACTVKCSDLAIGFGVVSGDQIYVEFAPQYGNSVNEAFSLTGDNNKISFTDKNGKRLSFNITSLKNEDTAGPFDLSKLAQDGTIEVNVCVAFTTPTGEYCNRCVQDIYDPNTNTCNYCEIKATGDVTIMYKSCSTSEQGYSDCDTKALKLNAGDDAVLRKSYSIVYISDPDAITGMECLQFGEYEDMKCWLIFIQSYDSPSRAVVGIRYKGTDYMFNKEYLRVNNYYDGGSIINEILAKVPLIIAGNYLNAQTNVRYYRVNTLGSVLTGWGIFTKKKKEVLAYSSAIQVMASEATMKEISLIYKQKDVDYAGDTDDIYGLTYAKFAPIENYEDYTNTQENGVPVSLCNPR